MAITVNWATGVISVPRGDMDLVQLNPVEIRELNIDNFRRTLKSLEDDAEGMGFLKTHTHNTAISLGGIVYARVVEILDPYTITFEDGQYAVNLVGANSNIGDKVNVNQVSVRSANSAGLISLPAVEYSSFNGGVIIDTIRGVSGTLFPIGTLQQPVNNLRDALLIADYRGFQKIFVHSDLNIDGVYNLNNFHIEGLSHVSTRIHIEPAAMLSGATITDCEISGTLDGNNEITDCIIGNIEYFNGHIHSSSLAGTIVLNGNDDALFKDCLTNDMTITPVIDMGVSGQNLIMTDYSGNIIIKNMDSQTNQIGIGLAAGQIFLDSATMFSGNVIVSGIGALTDDVGNRILTGTWNSMSIVNNLLNKDTIREATQLGSAVYIDNINGTSGITFPIGTIRVPVNNLDDAITIAEKSGIQDLRFIGDFNFSATTNINDFNLIGDGITHSLLTFNSGAVINDCKIFDVSVTGVVSDLIGITRSRLLDLTISNVIPSSQEIIISETLFGGTITLPSDYTGRLTVIDSYSNTPGNDTPILNFNDSVVDVQFRNYTGGIKFLNITQDNVMSVDLISGQIKLDPTTVTNATIVTRGVGKLIDGDTTEHIPSGTWNGGVTIYNDIISKGTISESVWDEPIEAHTTISTMGYETLLNTYNGRVYVDENATTNSLVYPSGTPSSPVATISDAIIIANTYGITTLHSTGSNTITSNDDVSGFTILSPRSTGNIITVQSGATTNYTYFNDLTVSGTMNGPVRYTRCVLGAIVNFDGGAKDSLITNAIDIVGNGANYFTNCDTYITATNSTKSIIINDKLLNIIRCRGNYELLGKTGTDTTTVDLVAGHLVVHSSCVSGNIDIFGLGIVEDNSSVGCVVNDEAVSEHTIPNMVWDTTIADHLIDGSTGKALATSSSGGVDYGLLAEAVWDETLNSHTVSDSAAELIKQIAILAEEVHRINGLDLNTPLVVTQTSRIAGDIDQTISTIGVDETQQTTITRD